MSDPDTDAPLQAEARGDATRWSWRFALAATLVLAFALRARGLGVWWLNPDEGIYYSILTRADLGSFWNELAANAHPPLFYVLLRALGLFTWDFVALRSFSLLCGVAAVAAAWAAARELAGRGTAGEVSGLTAALLVAVSPAAIELSQVIRPYMLLLALLLGAAAFLLRFLREPSTTRLAWFQSLAALALLTHYSAVLAVAVFALVTLADGVERGFDRAPWKRLAISYCAPVLVFGVLFTSHLSRLSESALADEALNGWLSPYMVGSPSSAWLGFLGYQTLLVPEWARPPAALLMLIACGMAIARRAVVPATMALGALAVGLTAALLGAYPFGATRHTTWLLAFSVPALGWLAASVVRLPPARARAAVAGLAGLLLAAAPLGRALRADEAPWAPTERLLREENLALLDEVLDPQGEPELVVMSSQTFYLLLPFYPSERELAVFAPDSSLFHFRYGSRNVLVMSAWDFTAGPDAETPGHLVGTLEVADDVFPELALGGHTEMALLVGGWRPPLIGELAALSKSEPFLLQVLSVPGLFAFRLDLPALREAFTN